MRQRKNQMPELVVTFTFAITWPSREDLGARYALEETLNSAGIGTTTGYISVGGDPDNDLLGDKDADGRQRETRPGASMPAQGTPTNHDLRALPRWARVAFAARCARRVEPLFRYFWPDAAASDMAAIAVAVQTAEDAARYAGVAAVEPSRAHLYPASWLNNDNYAASTASGGYAAANAAAAAAEVAYAAAHRVPRGNAVRGNAPAPANAATFAARTAVSLATDCCGVVAHAAAIAACDVDSAFGVNAIAAMNRDFQLLKEQSQAESWDDSTPVPPELLGPLWPDGPPRGTTGRVIGRRRLQDGCERDVFQTPDGRQYVSGDEDERVYGVWLP